MLILRQNIDQQPRLKIKQIGVGSLVSRLPQSFQRPLSPSVVRKSLLSKMGIEETLFDNKATLKILTSRVAVYFNDSQRRDLFKQLDSLLDVHSWADDSVLISSTSFFTFLRFITWKKNVRRVGLSVSSHGNMMGSWFHSKKEKLTIEFLSSDEVRLVLLNPNELGNFETLAFAGSMQSVDKVLSSFDAVKWYSEAA